MKHLEIKSAGAARGLIDTTAGGFFNDRQKAFHAGFAAVGSTFQFAREAMLARDQCDLVVLTPNLAHRLAEEFPGRVILAGTLGFTPTCLACRQGVEPVDIATVGALRRALGRQEVILTGDIHQSTIGRHIVRVLDSLGFTGQPEVIDFPGGAQAVAALATTGRPALACAQLTEIRLHPEAVLVGPLPAEFYLTTEYVVAVIDGSATALAFAQFLTGDGRAEQRLRCGFESR